MSVCAHARVCDHPPVKVLNFTNDLTMPPGAGPAPLDTFVCLSPYLESVPTVVSESVPVFLFLKNMSLLKVFKAFIKLI